MRESDDLAGEPLLTPAEMAEQFHVVVETTSRWAKAGRVHVVRTPGGQRRFFANEVKALLRGEKWTPPPGAVLENAPQQRPAA